MTKEVPLTTSQYIQSLNSLSGMKLRDCYHTQDSVLRFSFIDEQRKITLILDGDWQLQNENEIICSSSPDESLDYHEYYQKLRNCAAGLKKTVHSLSSISFKNNAENAVLTFDNGWKLNVQKNQFGLLGYQNDETQEYVMYSIDEKTHKPRYYKSLP